MPGFDEIRNYDVIIDETMEWLGRKWTTGMIKMQMREMWPGIKVATIYAIISRARKKICALYKINPNDYKGSQISFYEYMMRKKGGKDRDKIKAAERLDALFGLEQISAADPEDIAAKIIQFKKDMDSMMGANPYGDNRNDGNSETNASVQEEITEQHSRSEGDDSSGTVASSADELNEKPTSSVVDSEEAEVIKDLKECNQRLEDMKAKPQKDPDNI